MPTPHSKEESYIWWLILVGQQRDTEPAPTKWASFARLAPIIGQPIARGPEHDTTWMKLISDSIRPAILTVN